MKHFISAVVVSALFLAALTDCPAQIRVTKGLSEAAFLDISGFKSGADNASLVFRRTLESDLTRSGWFKLAGPARPEFTLIGGAEEGGARLVVRSEAYNTMTRARLFSKTYKGGKEEARSLAHQLADDLVFALTGQPGMASSKIVLVGNRTGQKELYICDADGFNLRQLTRDNAISLAPRWSPDGKQIVYTSYYRTQFPEVFLITMQSGRRQCLAGFPGLNASAAFSPDGRKLALILSKDGNPDLFIMDINSERLTRLTASKRAAEASPSWSPDGRQIVFVSDSSGTPQLYIIGQEGGEPRRIAVGGSQNVDPDWGPNGYIVYSSFIGGRFQLYVFNPAAGETKQITPPDASYEDPSWAPDGRHIFCVRKQNYNSRVFIVDTLGPSCINLLRESVKGDWFSPDCSGKYIKP
ncbi:MAG: biopolymer transporter Tol [Kiritimatiellae bacterium]|nr:biopolymer transporter Tol [Kiritimatiellia bacterium]